MNALRLSTLAAVGLAAAVAIAPATFAKDIRTLQQVYSLDKAESARIEIPAGEVRIEPSPDRKLRVTATLECHDWDGGCEARARQIELAGGYEDGTFVLKVEGMRKFNNHGLSVNTALQLPRDVALALVVGAGEVKVLDLENDVRVDLGAGEATVRMNNHDVRSVSIDVGLGDATLRHFGHRIDGHGWISKTLNWSSGPGSKSVHMHIGVGEGRVALN